jgi:hypothetical protein
MEIGSVRLGPARHTMILGNHCEITTLIAQDHETERTPPAGPPRPAPDSGRPGAAFRDHGQCLAQGAPF